jgi:hypothetical protein
VFGPTNFAHFAFPVPQGFFDGAMKAAVWFKIELTLSDGK